MEQMKKVELRESMTKLKHRLTVVQTVYHQLPGQQPKSYESRFDRELETHEQPYERHTSVEEEWQPLDVGWLKDVGVGMLVISNDEGNFNVVNPSKEEKEAVAKKILEISYEEIHYGNTWLIYPRESMRACPTLLMPLFIRCQSGNCKYTLQAFPK